jgi:gliding motility-associated protein GldM
MSLPKEPRQKMINMMYLVLTALLALNVSAEVLNAFKTVNNSINTSNKVVKEKNDLTYQSLAQKLADPQTKALAEVWAPKAFKAKKLAGDIFDYIEALKTELVNRSQPGEVEGKKSYNLSNLDEATRMMVVYGHGQKLYDSLIEFKNQLLDIFQPASGEFADNADMLKELARVKADFQKQLPLNLTVPESQSGNAATSDSAKSWTLNYFHMTPTVAALTILSKFQSDIRNSESQVVDYFHKKIGEVVVHYDKVGVISGASSSYVMPGDKLTVYAGVGAFSSAVRPEITIGGRTVEVDQNGKASVDIVAGGSGAQAIAVTVRFKDQNGKEITYSEPIKYTVGTPSGIAVSADKMNVLYIMGDIPNPVTISGGSGSEKISATFSGGSMRRVQGSAWEVFPKQPGDQYINVTLDGKTTPKKFRVKYLPNPATFVSGSKGGSMSAAQFKAQGGLIAKLEESDFEAQFKVVSYKVGALGGPIVTYYEAPNQGNRWTGAAEALINKAGPGTIINFDDIRVVGPDGRNREVAPMTFRLK